MLLSIYHAKISKKAVSHAFFLVYLKNFNHIQPHLTGYAIEHVSGHSERHPERYKKNYGEIIMDEVATFRKKCIFVAKYKGLGYDRSLQKILTELDRRANWRDATGIDGRCGTSSKGIKCQSGSRKEEKTCRNDPHYCFKAYTSQYRLP